jgi:uncharacterized protein (DUF1800 family)
MADAVDALETSNTVQTETPTETAQLGSWSAAAAASLLAACGGGAEAPSAEAGPDTNALAGELSSGGSLRAKPTQRDAARFLLQATFGITGKAQVDALVSQGYDAWISGQLKRPAASHLAYIESQRGRDQAAGETPRVSEEMSYEAVWQQWLRGEDQLRARMSWALLQFFVISNIAPDIRPVAMSSYMDMLNRNAFGNWRKLLEDVTLHPAMGYYLNMLESEKENPSEGTHPNENYAREVLQLFSIGLVKLNLDGTPELDANGRTQPTFDEPVVKGFARAFSGFSYGGLDNSNPDRFHDHDDNDEALWVVPMKGWASYHEPGEKRLLNGARLSGGGSPEQDLSAALDNIFQHPNVPPFFCKQLIQRLVTSNPSPGYVKRVAGVFLNDGKGVRGNLMAVLRAVLLDTEARTEQPLGQRAGFGKLREPVIRFAHFLRGLGATSTSGSNRIHYLDSADDGLGQSPLLAPSVFNFYSPFYRPAGPVAAAGLVAPEFQITSETSTAGSLNFFHDLFQSEGYGWPEQHRMNLQLEPWVNLASGAAMLVDQLDLVFFGLQMTPSTRQRLLTLINAIPADQSKERVQSALTLVALSPDFVVQH